MAKQPAAKPFAFDKGALAALAGLVDSRKARKTETPLSDMDRLASAFGEVVIPREGLDWLKDNAESPVKDADDSTKKLILDVLETPERVELVGTVKAMLAEGSNTPGVKGSPVAIFRHLAGSRASNIDLSNAIAAAYKKYGPKSEGVAEHNDMVSARKAFGAAIEAWLAKPHKSFTPEAASIRAAWNELKDLLPSGKIEE